MDKQDSPYKTDEAIWTQLHAWMTNFIRMLLNQPDLKDARKLVEEQTKMIWGKYFGLEMERLQLEIAALEERLVQSDARIAALAQKLNSIKPCVSLVQLGDEAGHQCIPFSHWRSKDKAVVLLTLFSAFVVLTMGAANVYANIMGSGSGVFIERPLLGVIISGLLPAGSVAMKFVTDIMESNRAKAFYAKTMHGLTVVVLLSWTILFALTFHGLPSQLTFDDLEGSNTTSIALTWVQLLAEMLVGAVLFQVAADVYSKYTPNTCRPNPEHIETESALKNETIFNDGLRDERNEKRGIMAALKASLGAFVNDMNALYRNMRQRLDESSPL